MFESTVHLERTIEVAWGPEEAYGLVADVPLSASHVPGLKGLDPLGEARFRWRLERIKLGKFDVDASYTADYTCDPAARTVGWVTVEPAGSVRATGQWTVRPAASGSWLDFQNKLELQLALPRLAWPIAKRAVPAIYQERTAAYLRRIAERMGGRLL